MRSSAIASRSAEPSPSTCSWPTNSSSVEGRRRMASGARSERRADAASEKRSLMPEVCSARGRRRPHRSGSSAPPVRMSSEVAAMWGGAEYERIAERFAPVHDALVSALAPRPGERFLDVATGTGEVALRAARAGVAVSALDLAPALLEQARAKAATEGLAIDWIEGNAQELPYENGSFDAVASNFGVILAPDPDVAAAELARVCARGSRLGITAWLPSEGLHSIYARFSDDAGEDPTERWGTCGSVSELLEAWFELEIEERVWHLEGESPSAVWELMS